MNNAIVDGDYNMDSINYLSLGLSGTSQICAVDGAVATEETDLTDGLSLSELEKIDKNGDGEITEAEFKAAFGGDSKEAQTYWNTYKSFYNSTLKAADKADDIANNSANKESNKSFETCISELSIAADDASRDSLLAQITSLLSENNLSKEERAKVLQSAYNAIQASFKAEITGLNEQLKNAKTDDEKNIIIDKINERKSQEKITSVDIQLEINQMQSTLPEEQSNKLMSLYKELAKADSYDKAEKINDEINALQQEYFGSSNNSEYILSKQQQCLAYSVACESSVVDIYKQLSETTDNNKRAELNEAIKSTEDKFIRTIDKINIDIFCAQTNSDDTVKEKLVSLYEALRNATTDEERAEILKQIEALRDEILGKNEEETPVQQNAGGGAPVGSSSGSVGIQESKFDAAKKKLEPLLKQLKEASPEQLDGILEQIFSVIDGADLEKTDKIKCYQMVINSLTTGKANSYTDFTKEYISRPMEDDGAEIKEKRQAVDDIYSDKISKCKDKIDELNGVQKKDDTKSTNEFNPQMIFTENAPENAAFSMAGTTEEDTTVDSVAEALEEVKSKMVEE